MELVSNQTIKCYSADVIKKTFLSSNYTGFLYSEVLDFCIMIAWALSARPVTPSLLVPGKFCCMAPKIEDILLLFDTG